MTIETNSAQQLYDLLAGLHDFEGHDTKSFSDLLAAYFQQNGSKINFGDGYNSIISSFTQVKEDLNNCSPMRDRTKTLHLRTIQTMQGFISPSFFATNWLNLKLNYLSNDNFDKLHIIADTLEQNKPRKIISEEGVDTIRGTAEELRGRIEKSEEMNSDLRLLLLSQLEKLISSINLYNKFGDHDFKIKAKEIIGDFMSNPIYHNEVQTQEIKDFASILKTCTDAISKTHNVSGKIVAIANHAEALTKFLPG